MKLINNKGQSLVELIVAIAVIEIGIFAVWSLFLVNFNAEREAEMRIVGVNLAREGVEAVKNVRDSNWLKNTNNKLVDSSDTSSIWPWDKNLEPGDYAVNFDSNKLDDSSLDALYINQAGYYSNVPTDSPTPYKRTIKLNSICCDDTDDNLICDNADTFFVTVDPCDLKIGINVVCKVEWEISGKDRQVTVEDNLFNWKR